MASQPDLAARALSHVAETRADAQARIQRDNADLFAWRAPFLAMGESGYLRCLTTGREWGTPAEQRARDAGGKGVAVQASATCKPGKPLKERR